MGSSRLSYIYFLTLYLYSMILAIIDEITTPIMETEPVIIATIITLSVVLTKCFKNIAPWFNPFSIKERNKNNNELIAISKENNIKQPNSLKMSESEMLCGWLF